MQKQKALKNIITSVIFKIVLLVLTLVSRRYLLTYIGNEANGLFSLYTSIIGFLAIAELGIGTAITFSMYKPIVDDDKDTISALFYLYNKVYKIIFFIILGIGLIITPIIPFIAKDTTGLFNIYITYLLFLSSTLVTYLFAHKTSYINANSDNYLTTIVHSVGLISGTTLQIFVVLTIGRSNPVLGFSLFLLSIVIGNIIDWVLTELVFLKKYKSKLNSNKDLSTELKSDVVKQTKAMFFHKIGGLLVMTTDNIIISAFIGVVILGIYTNYITLMAGMVSILALVFSSITSIIGHSFAKNDKKQVEQQFNQLYVINFIIAFIFFLGYYAVINPSISIIFSKDLIMSNDIIVIIVLSYFIQFMRQSVLTYRNATGTFYNDRYKPLIEGLINLVLSLILVNFLGISGVLIGTIITNLFITHIIEPFVLYKHGFESSPRKYYIYNYIGISLFFIAVVIMNIIPFKDFGNVYIEFIVRGFTSVGISMIFLLLVYIISKDFRNTFNSIFKSLILMIKRKIKN